MSYRLLRVGLMCGWAGDEVQVAAGAGERCAWVGRQGMRYRSLRVGGPDVRVGRGLRHDVEVLKVGKRCRWPGKQRIYCSGTECKRQASRSRVGIIAGIRGPGALHELDFERSGCRTIGQ